MTLDRSFVGRNRTATERLRALAARLSDAELAHPVGEHWTVAIALAHLAFWDRRVLDVLERTEAAGQIMAPTIDLVVNDLSLPLWAALPGREAARLAVEAAEALDRRLESYPPALLAEVHAHTPRWVERALHRDQHLDEVEAALGVR